MRDRRGEDPVNDNTFRKTKRLNLVISILSFLFIAFLLPLNKGIRTFADGINNDNQTATAGDAEKNSEVYLSVDVHNKYDGMTTSYEQGYLPLINSGVMKVIVPLYTEKALTGDEITASVKLQNDDLYPVIGKNYMRSFRRDEKLSETGRNLYLIRFDLELKDERYNGSYIATVECSYRYGGRKMTEGFPISFVITDGKDKNAMDKERIEEPEDSGPTSEPKLILKKGDGFPERLDAGKTYELETILQNLSSIKSVQNITITLSCDTKGIILDEDSSLVYIDWLGAADSKSIMLKYRIKDNVPEGSYSLRYSISYDNPDALSLNSSGEIAIEVAQTPEVIMEVGDYPTEVEAGDKVVIPVQIINKGRCRVCNVECFYDVPGLKQKNSLYLGDIEMNSSAGGEIKTYATAIVDEDPGVSKYGVTEGIIRMTYEDESGMVYELSDTIRLKINELKVEVKTKEKDEKGKITKQLIWGIIIVIVVMTLLITMSHFWDINRTK